MKSTALVFLINFVLLIVTSCAVDNSSAGSVRLAKMNIDVSGEIPKNTKVKMELREIFSDRTKTYVGSIERRGGYSMRFPKHSFEIDLKADVSLAGLPADDDWILNANFIDKTFLRHVISFELFREMNATNRAANCQYVELELNNKYQGLYVLMEKLDKSSLAILGDDPTSFIFKEPKIFIPNFDQITPQDTNNFHQQTFPKVKDRNMVDAVENVRDFILGSSDRAFRDSFHIYFDVENVIDWTLLLLISNNNDGILKNFYLYKVNSETPLRFAPWDYDHSFGRDGDNELNMDSRPLDLNRSILFSRLLKCEWYTDDVKKRWAMLNDQGLLSISGLQNRIKVSGNAIRGFAMKNFDRWPVNHKGYFDANGFDQELELMLQFVELRHGRISKYIAVL